MACDDPVARHPAAGKAIPCILLQWVKGDGFIYLLPSKHDWTSKRNDTTYTCNNSCISREYQDIFRSLRHRKTRPAYYYRALGDDRQTLSALYEKMSLPDKPGIKP